MGIFTLSVVYDKPVNSAEELCDKIIHACREIDPRSLFASTHQSLLKGTGLCVAASGMQ